MASTATGSPERVALVVGNSGYELFEHLENPINDATDVAATLAELQFDVTLLTDADHAQMKSGLEAFGEAARGSEVALFYYAGHGFQVSERNYLLPVDADIAPAINQDDNTLALEKGNTVDLKEVIDRLELAPGVRLVFLDSCRDNPVAGLISDQALVDVDAQKGLAEVKATAPNFLISYATAPGDVAFDGMGDNSYFTEAFLRNVTTPGLSIGDLMVTVRRDVRKATGGRQIPWDSSSLTDNFYFDGKAPSLSQETMLWQIAADTREAKILELYLELYPGGKHETNVRSAIDEIDAVGAETGERSLELLPPEQQAERLWQVALRSRMRSLFEIYLERYPDGARAENARAMLDTLPPRDESSPAVICERLATHPNDSSARVSGNPYAKLKASALTAIKACRAAMDEFPELPHYASLLARAHAAAGDIPRALELYDLAAAQGDLRALVSLAQLYEAGTNVPADIDRAMQYYRQAVAGGSTDAMINLAVTLFQGDHLPRDTDRAIRLLQRASEEGAGKATYNLGVLALEGAVGTPEDAIGYFTRSITMGEDLGYHSAAILYDEGRGGVTPDPARAARLLLRGAAEDGGAIVQNLVTRPDTWSPDTISALQSVLSLAGYYNSSVDGVANEAFSTALQTWRNGGYVAELVTD